VAVNSSATAGTATSFDGENGNFNVVSTDKSGRDFRGKGLLEYVGGHYLRFAETGEYFLKQGADAPENFLAYADFDNTPDNGGRRKTWSAHVQDWNTGDPTWSGGKGKGIIGAVNYLASEEMNAFSFLPMNIQGDDKNVFMYISDGASDRTRFDCSKCDQWEIVFYHGTTKGMFLHFKTQETENELLLDGGNLGTERKMYYREMIARFGHNLALNWNLGEEINDATTAQKISWAQYFYDNDPYHHHIVIHNMGNPHYDLLGNVSKLTGFSLQTNNTDFSGVHSRVKGYIDSSVAHGKPWAVACDEPGDASHALRPDNDAGNSHIDGRKNGLWGTFMAGGWGNEWYFGYQHAHSDLTCQDWRSRDNWWDYCRYALRFFNDNNIPVWEMKSNDGLTSVTSDYCLAKEGEVYVIYLKNGGTTNLNLGTHNVNLGVKWYNPRTGGALQNGSVTSISGSGNVSIGNPPSDPAEDWAVLIKSFDVSAPTAPGNLGLEVLGESSIKVTWTAASDNESGISQYNVYRGGSLAGSLAGTVLEYTDTGLQPGTQYTYTVKAVNGGGIEGPAAGPRSATTRADQTDPRVTGAYLGDATTLYVTFSEDVDQSTAQTSGNYQITNSITVSSAVLQADKRTVKLTTSAHSQSINYTVTVSNVEDLSARTVDTSANSARYTFAQDKIWIYVEDGTVAGGGALKTYAGSMGDEVGYLPAASSTITFTVTIPEATTWYLWGRFYFSGADNDPNSFLVSVDGGSDLKLGNNKDFYNQWHWDGDGNVENGSVASLSLGTLSAGQHTIVIKAREPLGTPGSPDVLADMLLLTSDANYVPNDSDVPGQGTVINNTGLLYMGKQSIKIFPNPFCSRTIITLPSGWNSNAIYLYDIRGALIRKMKTRKGSNSIGLDADNFSDGIYLVKSEFNNRFLTSKMFVVR
jgi:hypothetical protein